MEFYYHEVDKDVLIVSADGGLSAQTADQFVGDLQQLIDSGLTKIIVDCSNLGYVSSYGLGVLIRIHSKLRRRGGDVKIAAVKSAVMEVLQLTGLEKLFSVYPDVNRARLAFRPRDGAEN
ncbi:MAG: STAS domain-containing protein [Phycisphaerae bacterium]|nr:STAS domain-containing protein [Phycisphaerae bacterium]